MPAKRALKPDTETDFFRDIDRRLAALPAHILRVSNHSKKLKSLEDVWIGSTDNIWGVAVTELLEWCAANSESRVYWMYIGALEGVGKSHEDDRYFSCSMFRIGFEKTEDALLFRTSSPFRDRWEWYSNSRSAKEFSDTVFVDYHEDYPRTTDATLIRDITEAEWGENAGFIKRIESMYEEPWTYDTNYVLAKDTGGNTVGFTLVIASPSAENVAEMAVIAVKKELRGHGIARLMMKSLLSALAERNRTLIVVTDKPEFYARTGCGTAVPLHDGRSLFIVSEIKGE